MSNFRNKSVNVNQFAMVTRPDVPRSSFKVQQRHLTTFDAGYLIPIFVTEMLPGDTFNLRHTIFCRMSTPIYPVMDNLYLDTFYFAIPLRLLWTNFKKMMGEQANPSDSIAFTTPQQVSPAGGYAVGSLQDYLGLPTTPMLGANTKSHSAFATRAYNFTWNEHFRDENLQNSITFDTGDGPDATPSVNYVLRRRGKRKDYFTASLPWPQKGNSGVSVGLAGTAPVRGLGMAAAANYGYAGTARETPNLTPTYAAASPVDITGNRLYVEMGQSGYPNIRTDLSAASGVLINDLRRAIMIQELLELDARGGTRYTEIVQAHFGVMSPDSRLQRPEYLGGGSKMINVSPVAQTGQTGLTGGTTPLGTLGAIGTVVDHGNGFVYSATEHMIILGLAAVRADLTYQQGIHRMWTRQTRYDYYWPSLAHLGEKAVRMDEIYCDGSAQDTAVWGYQEAWSEYRYLPSRVSSLFRSTASGTIDGWHLAQKFTSAPTLNDTFIQDTPPLSRVLAVGASANGQQFIADMMFDVTMARPMPMYSVPQISSIL